MNTVAALYVDPRGPYFDLEGVDPWDEDRDATAYDGPFPVVAHPPCGPWGRLYHMCKYQRPELGPIAVRQVQRWGGVLEHPADSKLWKAMDLPRPGELPDEYGGFTLSVRQVDWGHRAVKPTWLYVVGVSRSDVDERRPPRVPTAKITGNDRQSMAGLQCMGATERRLTPPEFAEWLVQIARKATT